jgi:hypothetical protein
MREYGNLYKIEDQRKNDRAASVPATANVEAIAISTMEDTANNSVERFLDKIEVLVTPFDETQARLAADVSQWTARYQRHASATYSAIATPTISTLRISVKNCMTLVLMVTASCGRNCRSRTMDNSPSTADRRCTGARIHTRHARSYDSSITEAVATYAEYGRDQFLRHRKFIALRVPEISETHHFAPRLKNAAEG